MAHKLFKSILKKFTYPLQTTSFYLQGQMDIHPDARWHCKTFTANTGGFFINDDPVERQIINLEPWDNTRRDMLILLLRTLIEKDIAGEMIELGVFQGKTAKLIHHYIPERPLHLFDTFAGFTERGVSAEKQNTDFAISGRKFAKTSLQGVKNYIAQQNDNVQFHPGYFPDSLPAGFSDKQFAFVHLDADLYEPILEALEFFYPRMSHNGVIVVHDYNAWPGARRAVDDFFLDKAELPVPMPDKSGSALIIKNLGIPA